MTDRLPIAERLAVAGLPPLPRTAWAEIDLDALGSNLEAIAAALPDGVLIQPVVKADAYGHGAVPIAQALLAAGAHAVCVATVDEALELRAATIEAPVLVLFPIPPAVARSAADADITVSVGDPVLLGRMLDELEKRPPARPLAIAVEVETGLGRCGFQPADIGPVVARIEASRVVVLASVWSHLTAAEDAARTSGQVARFAEATAGLEDDGDGLVGYRHLSASGAILAGTAPALDAVRPGLVVYGIMPEESIAAGPSVELAGALRPVMSIVASPIRVAELPAGSGIGYGPAFTTSRPSRIATLPLGYGDGYARTMSGRVSALVRGRRAPVVGTIAMDALMVDVTDVPGEPITIDDEFCLLGRQGDETIDVYELAHARTTISWEILAAMAARLPRVYTRSSGPMGVRTLIEGRSPWRSSSSGTATSATSKSTPS